MQGIEVALDFDGVIPEGFDVITLPEADYLMFQGEPFLEENYTHANYEVQAAIQKYNLQAMGFEKDESNPRIQLEPIGTRGYIELIPVKRKV